MYPDAIFIMFYLNFFSILKVFCKLQLQMEAVLQEYNKIVAHILVTCRLASASTTDFPEIKIVLHNITIK